MRTDPDLSPERRAQLTTELTTLEDLARAFPELADPILNPKAARGINPDGTYYDEFAKTMRVLEAIGEWDRMHDRKTDRMIEMSNDPEIHPLERPTEEDIKASQDRALLPSI